MKQKKIRKSRAKLKRIVKALERLNLEFEFCMEAKYPLDSRKMIRLDKKMQRLYIKKLGLEIAIDTAPTHVVSNPNNILRITELQKQ